MREAVLIPDETRVGRKFGATGTPSAILIDPTGKVASDVAVGGPNVIALASGKKPAPQAAAAPAANPFPLPQPAHGRPRP